MIRDTEQRFFAPCAKGVEEVLAGELNALSMKDVTIGRAGVYFCCGMQDCYRANMWLRTATRVLLELKRFRASTAEELYNGAKSIAWGDYFRMNQTFAVFAHVSESEQITHSGFAALKVKDAVADCFRTMYGRRPNVDSEDPDVRIFVKIHKEECTVNIDTSGESLHKRGYRTEKTEAPMRETLAAALLLIAGYDGSADFHDFMCGSGTLAIEASLIALNIAPGLKKKSFGFQRLISYNRHAWEKVVREAKSRVQKSPKGRVYASDIAKKSIEITKSNARRAGVRDFIKVSVADFKDTHKRGDKGIIVTNPPYGERLNAGETDKLQAMFKQLGDTLKKRYAGYDAYVFCGNLELFKSIGLASSERIVLYNGPIECRLVHYALY